MSVIFPLFLFSILQTLPHFPFCFLPFSLLEEIIFSVEGRPLESLSGQAWQLNCPGKHSAQECTKVQAEQERWEGLFGWFEWYGRGRRQKGIKAGEATWGHMAEGPVAESQCTVSSALAGTRVFPMGSHYGGQSVNATPVRKRETLLSDYYVPALLGDFVCRIYRQWTLR